MMYFTRQQIAAEAEKYKGWDFVEVYETLGLDYELVSINDETEEEEVHWLRDKIKACIGELCSISYQEGAVLSFESEKVLLACRAYTAALAANYKKDKLFTFKGPLYQGLNDIEHDETFLTIFSQLFTFMWE